MSDGDREGHALWEAVKRSARPLRKSARPPATARPVPVAPPPASPSTTMLPPAPRPALPQRAAEAPWLRVHAPPPPALNPGIDRRSLEKLRKGQMTVEARLDLHGMSREQAHLALTSFIGIRQGAGNRCVLVVTGKGKGILKGDVPRWLCEGRLKELVLSFSAAQKRDGGDGALYVLLRRQRNR